jgi:hypothetical protein
MPTRRRMTSLRRRARTTIIPNGGASDTHLPEMLHGLDGACSFPLGDVAARGSGEDDPQRMATT